MFIDQVRINVNGYLRVMSFRREAHVPKGGPDGGNGGHGGTLSSRRTAQVVAGRLQVQAPLPRPPRHARPGGARRYGADGEDLVLGVPLGTAVYELDMETQERLYQLADLTAAGQRVVVGEGGHGGRGATSTS